MIIRDPALNIFLIFGHIKSWSGLHLLRLTWCHCLFDTLLCDPSASVHGCCPFRAVVQCEEKLTISASWAKDEDISRLLQSLPNWANMAQPRQTRQKREDEEDFTRCVERNQNKNTQGFRFEKPGLGTKRASRSC